MTFLNTATQYLLDIRSQLLVKEVLKYVFPFRAAKVGKEGEPPKHWLLKPERAIFNQIFRK